MLAVCVHIQSSVSVISHTFSLERPSEKGRKGGPAPRGWASFSNLDRKELSASEVPLAHHALWPPGHQEGMTISPPSYMFSITAWGWG